MIKGSFLDRGGKRRPFIEVELQFPTLVGQRFNARLLVDTGADRTILAPLDALRFELELGVPLVTLPPGATSIGVGGQVATRSVPARLVMDATALEISLTILDAAPGHMAGIPSLLGRDVLAHFALFLEERTDRVLLLEPSEADALRLP